MHVTAIPTCVERSSWDIDGLANRYPPRFHNASKKAAYERLSDASPPNAGVITVSRWQSSGLPESRATPVALRVEPGFFSYAAADGEHWHLNFAAGDLFCAYAGALLAQDELQVLEHPLLACVREGMRAEGRSTLTVEDGRATPILLTDVPRQGELRTVPTRTRPRGLYGNEFASSPIPAMLEALVPIVPPTLSHIIAIEAPSYGSGRYSKAEVTFVLATAYAGFDAARQESAQRSPGAPMTIHTGWWGCGAYGGNRELMALLQLEAAALAGIDELVFHTGTAAASDELEAARSAHEGLRECSTVTTLVDKVVGTGYRWGVSDGT